MRSRIFLMALLTVVGVMGVMAGISIYFQNKQSSSHRHSSSAPAMSLPYNITVSKTRPGAFRMIMEALAVAPTHRADLFSIHIEVGTYVECVVVPKNLTNIVLVGDGAGVTIITMNHHAPDFETYNSATVSVSGNGFVAKFITFENSAGPGSQAVALMVEAERCAFYKCTLLGYQDTLYAKIGKQLFRECDIYGTIDFICGEAEAVFQSCNLFARSPSLVYFTAQGRRSLNEASAFVFQNTSFMVAPELETQTLNFVVYLGRPWFNYSTVVVIESYLSSIISPAGWAEWSGHPTDELTYIEYNNRGPGADTSQRVNWIGYRALTTHDAGEIEQYTVKEFLDGDYWIPRTGVPYVSGLVYG